MPRPNLDVLQNWDVIESFDADGGSISVPNTGVAKTLLSLPTGPSGFFIELVTLSVYDTAAVPVLTWDLALDGVILYPWAGQRIPGGQMSNPVVIERIIQPYSTIFLRGYIPSTAAGAFDIVGRIRGAFIRKR